MTITTVLATLRTHVHRVALAAGATAAAGLIAVLPASPAVAAATHACGMGFEVTVANDVSGPISLVGSMMITIDAAGFFHGDVQREGGQSLLVRGDLPAVSDRAYVSGRVNGDLLSVAVELSDGRVVMGVGTTSANLDACNGAVNGGGQDTIGGGIAYGFDGLKGDWLVSGCTSSQEIIVNNGHQQIVSYLNCTILLDGRAIPDKRIISITTVS